MVWSGPASRVAQAGGAAVSAGVPAMPARTGRISVLSSRFFLGLGSGATARRRQQRLGAAGGHAASRTLVILLHVEPAQQHNGLLAEQAAVDGIRAVDGAVRVHGHDAAAAAEAVVQAPKVHRADAVLPQRRRAHDARLHRHVQVGRAENGRRVARGDLGERDEFRVSCALGGGGVRVAWFGGKGGGGGGTLREALVPLMPRPMTSPLCTKTQPTGVSSEARASSAMLMALRMKASWYSRSGMGPPKTMVGGSGWGGELAESWTGC